MTIRTGAPEAGLPQVGAAVFYRLRFNGELVNAKVIDTWTDDYGDVQRLKRPRPGTLHLEVELNPERHHAADERGFRQDVAEGNAPGEFCRERPANEDAEWQRLVLRREVEHDINLERATGRKL